MKIGQKCWVVDNGKPVVFYYGPLLSKIFKPSDIFPKRSGALNKIWEDAKAESIKAINREVKAFDVLQKQYEREDKSIK